MTLLAICCILIICVILFAFDRYGVSFFLAVSALVAAFFVVPEVVAAINSVGWTTIVTVYVPVYLAIGAVVALIKWVLLNVTVRAAVAEVTEVVKSENINYATMSDVDRHTKFASAWNQCDLVERHRHLKIRFDMHAYIDRDIIAKSVTPRAKEEVERITLWILQWPIVTLALLVENLLFKLTSHIAKLIDAVFTELFRKFIGSAVDKI